jgi:AcrR family transcriptional regulator
MESRLEPRQARSKRTQEALLDALETLLQQRFFEQITIQEIAEEAGVAVGTVYRRFRNKEALLPALYRRLDRKMADWADHVLPRNGPPDGVSLYDEIHHLVLAHVQFYRNNAPILRTLYLNVRLDGELADPAVARRRKSLYMKLLQPVWDALAASGLPEPRPDQARCFILLLLSPLNERCLFPDNTPASSLRMSNRRFVEEVSHALYCYLSSPTLVARDHAS